MSSSARRTRLPRLLLLVLVLAAAGAVWVWLGSAGGGSTSVSDAAADAAADPTYDGSLDGGGTVAGGAVSDAPVTGTPQSDGDHAEGGDAEPPSPAETTSVAPPPALREVHVTPTYSGWDRPTSGVVVGGVVTGVIEDGGTCTVTLTRGGATAEGSSDGVPDARGTSCAEIRVPGDQLSSGEWSAILSYRSGTATGRSASFSVVVP